MLLWRGGSSSLVLSYSPLRVLESDDSIDDHPLALTICTHLTSDLQLNKHGHLYSYVLRLMRTPVSTCILTTPT